MVSVMVPPLSKLVAGVNTSTGLTEVPATPPDVMEVKMTCVTIPPEATPTDAVTSASVCTVMPAGLSATAAAPIVNPLRVMVKAVFAAMPITAVVMTMELPVMADVAVMVATDVLPAMLLAGLGVPAKNPGG